MYVVKREEELFSFKQQGRDYDTRLRGEKAGKLAVEVELEVMGRLGMKTCEEKER